MPETEIELRVRKAENQIADLKRQLGAEREGRMAAERIVDEVRARNRELEASARPLDPTPDMIEAGAQRLVRWETGEEKWPDAWSALDVRAARNDAERCWRSMWLVLEGKRADQT